MKFQKLILTIAVAVMLFSCASNSKQKTPTTPEDRITVIAQQMTSLQIEYQQAIIAAYQEFLTNFTTNNYETRVDARNVLNAKIEDITNNYEMRKLEIEEKKTQLLIELGYEEYLNVDVNANYNYNYNYNSRTNNETNVNESVTIENYITLINVYNNVIESAPVSREAESAEQLEEKCEQVINTLKATEPNAERIKLDLKGYSFKEADLDENYFRQCVVWTIEEEDDVVVTISNVADYGKTREYDVSIFWKRYNTGGAYYIDAKIGYILKDEWEFQFLMCNQILPDRTGRYDSFLTKGFYGFGGQDLYIRNNSDLTLVVCGQVYDETCRKVWEKFYLILEANESKKAVWYGVDKYQIDYVERY